MLVTKPPSPALQPPRPGTDDQAPTKWGQRISWSQRSWWTAAGLTLLVWASSLVGYVSAYPAVTLAVVVVGAWGLATILVAWTSTGSTRWFGVLPWATLALTIAAFAAWSVLQVLQAPGYGTDEIAFDQYAAQLLVHGADPYTRSMAPAFALFHVQPDGYTFRLNGAQVTSLSYPALSFLLYAPFLAAGLSAQVAVGLNVVAWAAAAVVLFCLLPRHLRPMAIVVTSLSVYIAYAVGGVTIALFAPLLAGAAYQWHRVDLTGWRRWRSPVLLGLALSVNQVPWFVLPFVLVGVAIEGTRTGGRRLGRQALSVYLGGVFVAFLLPNVPFIAWHPTAWLNGIAVPLLTPTVAAGQGLVALSLYLHLGGGSLEMFTLLSVVALLAIVVAYAATYPRLRPAAFLLPAVVLLLTTRSYGSYALGLAPAALVAAVTGTVRRPVRVSRPQRRVALAAVAVVAPFAALALAWPSPLSISILAVRTTGQLATVEQVTVRVHNRTDRSIRPHFTLNDGDAVTSFWLANGPTSLGPGQTATYTLLSPNFFAQPPISGGFQVVAFTTLPAAISHSGSYLPTTFHLALSPDAVNRIVPIGEEVTVRAQLLNSFDQPVHEIGVPVYMGQIIYSQSGLEYGEAIVNGSQQGQTPVTALTNADGVATFTIQGTIAGPDPVYFEANLVNDTRFYPYGYSEIVPIRFGS